MSKWEVRKKSSKLTKIFLSFQWPNIYSFSKLSKCSPHPSYQYEGSITQMHLCSNCEGLKLKLKFVHIKFQFTPPIRTQPPTRYPVKDIISLLQYPPIFGRGKAFPIFFSILTPLPLWNFLLDCHHLLFILWSYLRNIQSMKISTRWVFSPVLKNSIIDFFYFGTLLWNKIGEM